MRVIHICQSYSNPLYSELIERERAFGLELKVFFYSKKGTKNAPRNYPSYVCSCSPYTSFDRFVYFLKASKNTRAFFRFLQGDAFSPDICHAHSLFSAGFIAHQLHKKRGIPYIVAFRSTDLLFFRYRKLLRFTGLKILNDAAKIVFISKATQETFFSKYLTEKERGKLASKTCCIPNGINNYWLSNQPKPKPKNLLGIRILYVGDINKNKNILLTAKGCSLLAKRGEKVSFTVIGPVQDQKIVKALSKFPFVTVFGPKTPEELLPIFRSSDFFVMPSRKETFGLTYAEAISQGVPVVYTKGQGFDGQFDEGTVGYHISSKKSEEIARTILKMNEDYLALSTRCIASAHRYSWDRITKEYVGVYFKILEMSSDEED